MNNLEFLEQHIEEVQTSIKVFELDYELYHREGDKRDAEKLKQILNHLQQIKTKLEAYETGKEQYYTLEQVKKMWEENGFGVGITNRFIYIDRQESNNYFIFDRLELRCHSHSGWMNIELFDLITKTIKALEKEEKQ